MRGTILVIEDVPEMADLIVDNLEFEGFEAVSAPSAEDGILAMAGTRFDLVMLDLNLPGMDGFEFLQRLRKNDTVPVLIVSARSEESDLVTGLGIGADEYLGKPFSPRALVARARALIRRSRDYQTPAAIAGTAALAGTSTSQTSLAYQSPSAPGAEAQSARRIAEFGPYGFDPDSGILTRDGNRVVLSVRETAVLAFLVRAGGKAHRPEEIYEAAWGKGYGDLTAVGVYIQRLRRKLEVDPASPLYILTERGFGYRFQSGGNERS